MGYSGANGARWTGAGRCVWVRFPVPQDVERREVFLRCVVKLLDCKITDNGMQL